MKKLIVLLCVVIFAFSFTACNEDPLEEINPNSELSTGDVQSTEPDEVEPPPKED